MPLCYAIVRTQTKYAPLVLPIRNEKLELRLIFNLNLISNWLKQIMFSEKCIYWSSWYFKKFREGILHCPIFIFKLQFKPKICAFCMHFQCFSIGWSSIALLFCSSGDLLIIIHSEPANGSLLIPCFTIHLGFRMNCVMWLSFYIEKTGEREK